MSIAYIALGSNLGNREENILKSIDLLKSKQIETTKRSSIIETEPVGLKEQPKFLNCVIKIETELPPIDLLNTTKEIEKNLGRIKTIINGPRIIDLDILLYDDIIINTDELTIPHPRIMERSFVLDPLNEIDPDLAAKLINENRKNN